MKNKFIYYLPLVPVVGMVFVTLIAKKIIPLPEHTFVDTIEINSKRAYVYAWYQTISLALFVAVFVYLSLK